jgi:hypothetical protein
MRTLAQRKDRLHEKRVKPATHAASEEARRVADREAWDRTDRPFRFLMQDQASPGVMQASSAPAQGDNPARTRWLEENDVHTKFLDAGIGCCWFAHKGDEEPVTGETEYEAIARLARKNGLALWSAE